MVSFTVLLEDILNTVYCMLIAQYVTIISRKQFHRIIISVIPFTINSIEETVLPSDGCRCQFSCKVVKQSRAYKASIQIGSHISEIFSTYNSFIEIIHELCFPQEPFLLRKMTTLNMCSYVLFTYIQYSRNLWLWNTSSYLV